MVQCEKVKNLARPSRARPRGARGGAGRRPSRVRAPRPMEEAFVGTFGESLQTHKEAFVLSSGQKTLCSFSIFTSDSSLLESLTSDSKGQDVALAGWRATARLPCAAFCFLSHFARVCYFF